MNADLTFNSIVFKKTFDEKDFSERRDNTRGVNLPDSLTIQQQDYVDSASKVAGKRFTARVDRVTLDPNNALIKTSLYFVIAVPSTAVSGDTTAVVATFKALVADANFITNVLNSEK